MMKKKVVSAAVGRALVRSRSCRFLGFVVAGASSFALLSPAGSPGCVWVLLGVCGRPLPGVRGSALAFVASWPA